MGRVVLFLAIALGVLFTVFNFIYSFAQKELVDNYTASVNHAKGENFANYLETRYHWIVFLAVIIFINIFMTAHNAYGLAVSQNTARFQIYLIAILLAFTCWGVIDRISLITLLFEKASFQGTILTPWAINVLYGLSIFILLLLLLSVLVNVRRYRLAFLMLGSIFLILLPILTAAAG
jgi:hypothetical protein